MARHWKLGLLVLTVQALYWLVFAPMQTNSALPADVIRRQLLIATLDEPTLEAFADAEKSLETLSWTGCCRSKYYGASLTFDSGETKTDSFGMIGSIAADNYHVYLNGEPFYTPGRLLPEPTYHASKRQLLRIPRAALKKAENELVFLTARGSNPYTDFYPFVLGDYEQVSKAARKQLFFLNEFRQGSALIAALIALYMLVALTQMANKRYAFWLFLLATFFSLRSLNYFWFDFPFSSTVRLVYYAILTNGIAMAWLCFVDAWSGRSYRWLPVVASIAYALSIVVIVASWLWLPFDSAYDAYDHILVWFAIAMVAATAVRLLVHLLTSEESRTLEAAILCLCITALGADTISEMLWHRATAHVIFSTPFLLIALTAVFAGRNIRLFESLHGFERELQATLAEKEIEIAANYARETDLLSKQRVLEERQRIMRDMHDGLGGNLIATALGLQSDGLSSDQASRRLFESIDDLRLIIDSLDCADETIAIALGAFRVRAMESLKAADIDVSWKIDEQAAQIRFQPHVALDIYRILQEATTNILRHSDASAVAFEFSVTDDAFTAVVQDNGCGYDASANCGSQQHGLRNMNKRAHGVGARLTTESSDSGTRITLDIQC